MNIERPQHVIGLSVENVKRLFAIELKFDATAPAGTVIITGDNAAGKSSLLDAIACAFNPNYIPDVPIRTGAEKARVVIETEDLIVTRRFTEKSDYLEVKSKDGVKQSSPQALLDAMTAQFGFDPLAFGNLRSDEQRAMLLKVCPVSIDLLDNARKTDAKYSERADANREVKRLEGVLNGLPVPSLTAPAPIDVSAKVAELEALREQERGNQETRAALVRGNEEADGCVDEIRRVGMTIEQLKKQLLDAETALKCYQDALVVKERAVQELKIVVEKLPDLKPKAEAIKADIAAADKTNAAAQEHKSQTAALQKTKAELETARKTAATRDAEHQELVTARANALKSADFPIEGLSIDEDGQVLFSGLPLKQASQAQRIKIGVALAAAANPKLKVAFIREGSLLDQQSMSALEELAKAYGLQVFVERVTDSSPTAIHIVNGAVEV